MKLEIAPTFHYENYFLKYRDAYKLFDMQIAVVAAIMVSTRGQSKTFAIGGASAGSSGSSGNSVDW